jgi:hypothetical protein
MENYVTLASQTKLTISNIRQLLNLCLSSTNFTFNGRHHTTKDSEPIGLLLMVTIAQLWMIHTMVEATKIAITRGIQLPKHLVIYIDDCFCSLQQQPLPHRPGLHSTKTDPAAAFNNALNSVHPRLKFTREEEKDSSLAFLDVHLTLLDNGWITTRVYRKPTNTNILIKPQSC